MRRRVLRLRWLAVLGAVTLVLYGMNASWLAPDRTGRPFVVAHRGLGQPYDRNGLTGQTCTAARMQSGAHDQLENTIRSIGAAFELGASIVEFDVQPTADGRFVVFHDATLDCRTNGSGTVRDHTLAELQRLDIGYGYTPDGGRTWPFLGRGIGLMPSLEQVFRAFPDGAFLVDMKGGNAADGRRLGAQLAALRATDGRPLFVHGPPEAVAAVTSVLPTVTPITRRKLKRCLLRYEALGWSGFVPTACRETLLTNPINVAPWLWGWPDRFLRRMEQAGTRVVLLGDYGGEGFSTPLDDPTRLADLPPGFDGGIWTDRIDLLGPALAR